MQQYRITTIDGFILGYGASRKQANEVASQQSRQLSETIVIQHKVDGEYEKIATVKE